METELTALLGQLKAKDEAIRAAAAERLCRLGEGARPAAVGLVEACGDSSEPVREWAVAALEEIGPPETSDLTLFAELLSHSSPDVAYWAATLIGRLGATGGPAVPKLGEALSDRPEKSVQQRIVWAFGKIGPPAASQRDRLQALAESSDRRMARLAQRALDGMG